MTYRVGNHHGVTIVNETDTAPCGRPDHDCARGHLVAVVVNGDQELAKRICELLNDGCTGGAAEALDHVAVRRDILAMMARKAGADTVVVDSLKDAAIGLSDDAVGAGYNRARQHALEEGVQVLELHHTVKRGSNGSEPNTLADVYGSTWLTSGAGSVVSLFGEAGDPVVSWRHLKQPMHEVGPFRVVHDHDAGTSQVEQTVDLVALIRRTGAQGLTALEYAVALFEKPNPSRALKEKARRLLEKKVDAGFLSRVGGEAGGPPARYYLRHAEVHEGVHAA